MFKGRDDAWGTPPTPVAVAEYVPDGAASDVAIFYNISAFELDYLQRYNGDLPGKLPEPRSAESTA
jgi:hypothetical protein